MNRALTIAMIGPFAFKPKGTVSARAFFMARALVKRGHRVTILMPPYDNLSDSGRAWEQDGVRLDNMVLRRTDAYGAGSAVGGGEQIRHGELAIDVSKRLVHLAGRPVELTAKEYDLLLLFARTPGRAYDRQQLLDLVWGYQFEGYQHTVNSHINRLRGKIERDPSNPEYIETVWGFGYRFAGPGEPA